LAYRTDSNRYEENATTLIDPDVIRGVILAAVQRLSDLKQPLFTE
jgi:hypothetical protein